MGIRIRSLRVGYDDESSMDEEAGWDIEWVYEDDESEDEDK